MVCRPPCSLHSHANSQHSPFDHTSSYFIFTCSDPGLHGQHGNVSSPSQACSAYFQHGPTVSYPRAHTYRAYLLRLYDPPLVQPTCHARLFTSDTTGEKKEQPTEAWLVKNEGLQHNLNSNKAQPRSTTTFLPVWCCCP